MRSRLFFFLRQLSIRQKLQSVIMASVAAALVLACGALLAFTIAAMRNSIRGGIGILAQVIGENSTAALSFNDARAAADLLQGLKVQPSIARACIYSARGELFARYTRAGMPENWIPPVPPAKDESGFKDGMLFHFHTIQLEGQTVGAIYLQSDLSNLRRHIADSIWVSLLILAASGLLAYLLGAQLQN